MEALAPGTGRFGFTASFALSMYPSVSRGGALCHFSCTKTRNVGFSWFWEGWFLTLVNRGSALARLEQRHSENGGSWESGRGDSAATPRNAHAVPCISTTFPHRGRTFPRPGRTFPHRGRTFPHRGRTFFHRGRTFFHRGRTFFHRGRTFP